MKSSLFVVCAFGVLFKSPLPDLKSQLFIPMLPSENVMITTFTFRSLIYFESFFIWFKVRVQIHTYSC
jgi:hypothetical protein